MEDMKAVVQRNETTALLSGMNLNKDLPHKLGHTEECLDMAGMNAVVQRPEIAGLLSDVKHY
jgi:hypothetical protein